MINLDSSFIVIVAPRPATDSVVEGWTARIAAVDEILSQHRRIYVSFSDQNSACQLKSISDELFAISLDLQRVHDRSTLEDLIERSRFVYVHTLAAARHVSSYIASGKVVVDFHGIGPEEAKLNGEDDLAAWYGGLERSVVKQATHLVVVTQAMVDHLRAKYPDCSPNYIVLPAIPKQLQAEEGSLSHKGRWPHSVVYAGGTQPWQNIDLMLRACADAKGSYTFSFYSNDHHKLREQALDLGIRAPTSFDFAATDDLRHIYRNAEFGFILRDGIPVNLVACPTKLCEYLAYGVVPIVKSPDVGDFRRLGYRYVKVEDFIAGRVPTTLELTTMRKENFAVFRRLKQELSAAQEELLGLEPKVGGPGQMAGFYAGRDSVFPTYAEAYANARLEAASVAVVQITRPTDSLSFSFGAGAPASAVRVLPLVADKLMHVGAITLTLDAASPMPDGIEGRGLGDVVNGALFMPRAGFIELNLRKRCKVTQLHLETRYTALGPYARSARADAAIAQAEGELALRVMVRAGARSKQFDVVARLTHSGLSGRPDLEEAFDEFMQLQARVRELEPAYEHGRQRVFELESVVEEYRSRIMDLERVVEEYRAIILERDAAKAASST